MIAASFDSPPSLWKPFFYFFLWVDFLVLAISQKWNYHIYVLFFDLACIGVVHVHAVVTITSSFSFMRK